MAGVGLKPLFLTGANAKIVFGTKVLGYAANVSYAVATPTIPVEVMGRYEVVSHEPVSYFVSGTMDVVRYTEAAYASATKVVSRTNSNGNRAQMWVPDQFNPGGILASLTCDLIISQKLNTYTSGDTGAADIQEAFRVTDCRMTSRSSMLDKRGIWFERYTYDGILFYEEGKGNEVYASGDDDLGPA